VLQYLGANDEVKAAAGYLRVMPTNVRYEIAATRLINVECSYGYTARKERTSPFVILWGDIQQDARGFCVSRRAVFHERHYVGAYYGEYLLVQFADDHGVGHQLASGAIIKQHFEHRAVECGNS
jgi:hypothetical protein